MVECSEFPIGGSGFAFSLRVSVFYIVSDLLYLIFHKVLLNLCLSISMSPALNSPQSVHFTQPIQFAIVKLLIVFYVHNPLCFTFLLVLKIKKYLKLIFMACINVFHMLI